MKPIIVDMKDMSDSTEVKAEVYIHGLNPPFAYLHRY